jgi:hypothetical protein
MVALAIASASLLLTCAGFYQSDLIVPAAGIVSCYGHGHPLRAASQERTRD